MVDQLVKEGAGGVEDEGMGKSVESGMSRGEWEERRIWKILEKEVGGL